MKKAPGSFQDDYAAGDKALDSVREEHQRADTAIKDFEQGLTNDVIVATATLTTKPQAYVDNEVLPTFRRVVRPLDFAPLLSSCRETIARLAAKMESLQKRTDDVSSSIARGRPRGIIWIGLYIALVLALGWMGGQTIYAVTGMVGMAALVALLMPLSSVAFKYFKHDQLVDDEDRQRFRSMLGTLCAVGIGTLVLSFVGHKIVEFQVENSEILFDPSGAVSAGSFWPSLAPLMGGLTFVAAAIAEVGVGTALLLQIAKTRDEGRPTREKQADLKAMTEEMERANAAHAKWIDVQGAIANYDQTIRGAEEAIAGRALRVYTWALSRTQPQS